MNDAVNNLDLSPLQSYLEKVHRDLKACRDGEVASYIPELLRADPEWFGITIATVDGHVYQVGDTRRPFTIQSISKAFVYGLALEANGLDVMATKVDVEPSGEAFNSISLRPDTGRPFNPMINAGAIATAGMVDGDSPADKTRSILDCLERYTGHAMEIDEEVYQSEKSTGHRNRAIAHLLHGFGILGSPTEDLLDVYFQQCSINVNCRDLAVMGACLANNGVNPITGVRTLKTGYVPKVLSVMGTCGMYDYSGNWVYTVGMPAKSGVGGGIVAVLPGQLGIAVFSPRLDARGNSVRGIKVFEQLSADYGLHLHHSVRATTATVLRVAYDGSQVHSKKLRRFEAMRWLDENAAAIRVYRLQGDLMFGSTESVLQSVLADLAQGEYFILDLKHVFEIDRAACQMLQKLKELLDRKGKLLLFTHTADKYAFTRSLRSGDNAPHLFAFSDTDHALQWCEDQLLGTHLPQPEAATVALADQDICHGLTTEHIALLDRVARPVVFAPGQAVFRRGDRADSFYMILRGQVEVLLDTEAGGGKRLAMVSAGMSFGEMALLNRRRRSADVLALTDCECLQVVFDELPEQVKLGLAFNFASELASKLGHEARELQILD